MDFLASAPSLEQSVKELGALIKDEKSDLNEAELPGLDSLIDDWYDDNVDVGEEQFMHRILGVFRESTHKEVYDSFLEMYAPEQRESINSFVSGKATAQDVAATLVPSIKAVERANELRVETSQLQTIAPAQELIRGYENVEFENWGRTVKQTPAITYYPENVAEVRTIVKHAVQDNRSVRVSGFRHSWAPVFGRDQKQGERNNGDVLISTLTHKNAAVLPNFTSLPSSLFQPDRTELNSIREVDAAFVSGPTLGKGGKYVRVGTAATNEDLRKWCINKGNVTLPMNIIEVEITMGGANATICHGAGISHPTLSDLVRCIEYVDVNAQIQKLDMADADLMKAASGCFGLLGVVTHITLEFQVMITAVMRPIKLPVIEAVPPPPDWKDSDIPAPLRPEKPRTEEQKRVAQENFERRANEDYYAEWFWFPYSSLIWVNTWIFDSSLEDTVEYPSKTKTVFQVFGKIALNIAQNILQKIDALKHEPLKQTTLLSWLAMKSLDERKDSEDPIRTFLPNALHFERGVQNIRVRDMEVELPIQAKKGTTNERDYTNVQRAWWDAIIACYANIATCPMRMPLEMRIMADSDVTMAPQRGHKLGTCAIEILTLKAAADIWEPYAQQVLDKWMSYRDNEGKKLSVRPHWAKEWDQLQVEGRPWREKLRGESFRDEIAEFRGLMTRIGEKHGWGLGDIKRTFSNEVLDYLFFEGVDASRPSENGIRAGDGVRKKFPVIEEKAVLDGDSVAAIAT